MTWQIYKNEKLFEGQLIIAKDGNDNTKFLQVSEIGVNHIIFFNYNTDDYEVVRIQFLDNIYEILEVKQ